MTTRILVLGASGLLGYPTFLEARRRHSESVRGTYRTLPSALEGMDGLHRLDLRDFSATKSLLEELRPETVINCAGIVKSVCHDPLEAITVNAALPHFLAETLGEHEGRLLQVSTDCVFSGRRGKYRETDLADPEDLYGRSKLLGEVVTDPHLTVRTSFIGFEPRTERGLLAWFLAQKGSVGGFRRAIWSGLTADRLAIVLNDLALRRDVTGLLHGSGEAVDKDTLLRWIAEIFEKRDVTIEAMDEPRIDRSLDGSKLREAGVIVPPVREMLVGLRRWQAEHEATREANRKS